MKERYSNRPLSNNRRWFLYGHIFELESEHISGLSLSSQIDHLFQVQQMLRLFFLQTYDILVSNVMRIMICRTICLLLHYGGHLLMPCQLSFQMQYLVPTLSLCVESHNPSFVFYTINIDKLRLLIAASLSIFNANVRFSGF